VTRSSFVVQTPDNGHDQNSNYVRDWLWKSLTIALSRGHDLKATGLLELTVAKRKKPAFCVLHLPSSSSLITDEFKNAFSRNGQSDITQSQGRRALYRNWQRPAIKPRITEQPVEPNIELWSEQSGKQQR
jgi:hypothetical protein